MKATTRLGLLGLAVALTLRPAAGLAQQAGALRSPTIGIATGAHLQAYRFDDGVGARYAELRLFPVAAQQQLGKRLLIELYSAYAEGRVELDGETFTLTDITDTWIRTTLTLGSGAALTLGVNVPTGKPTHDAREAVVATVLSTDLLGFREASWGTGFSLAGGVSTARRFGAWNVTGGASYRSNTEFEPRADTAVVYAPGDERRLRLALSRGLGSRSTLSLGVLALDYSEDRLDGRNLFQPGPRAMGDMVLSFPLGGSDWSLYAADIWRERGDVTLPIITQGATVTRDSVFQVGRQNLVVVGLAGAIPLTYATSVRPNVDFRYQTGEDVGGQGWMVGAGTDVPIGLVGGIDLFPSVRALYGRIETRDADRRQVYGLEASFVVRWGGGG